MLIPFRDAHRAREANRRASEAQQRAEKERQEKARRASEAQQRAEKERQEKARRASEAQQRAEKERQEKARREKQTLLKSLREHFKRDFLTAYDFYQSHCTARISFKEYETEKTNYVRSWAKDYLNTDPDIEQAAAIGAIEGHVQVVARSW